MKRSGSWSVDIYDLTREANFTIHSDHAVTITVTSGEESLGLFLSECSGASREVLQEQLQLLLLNEAGGILVNDTEGLLHIVQGLAVQAACHEELLVVKAIGSRTLIQGGLDLSVFESSERHFVILLRCVEARVKTKRGTLRVNVPH